MAAPDEESGPLPLTADDTEHIALVIAGRVLRQLQGEMTMCG